MYLAFAEEHESLSSFQNEGKKMGACCLTLHGVFWHLGGGFHVLWELNTVLVLELPGFNKMETGARRNPSLSKAHFQRPWAIAANNSVGIRRCFPLSPALFGE